VTARPRLWLSALRRTPWPAALLISLAAWIACGAFSRASPGGAICGLPHGTAWRAAATGWMLMLGVMTPPLLVMPVRRVWRCGLRGRKVAGALAFASGYAAVGLAVAPIFLIAARQIDRWAGAEPLLVALLAALAWQVSAPRRWVVAACHRAPLLRSFGVVALLDAGRYGLAQGAACFAACGPWMLLPLVAPAHQDWAMLATMIAVAADRHWPARRDVKPYASSVRSRPPPGAPA
jgi:hypothetical protein